MAFADEPTPPSVLNESDVIRLVGTQGPAGALVSATEVLATARTRVAGQLGYPSIDWARETVSTGPTSGRGSQDLVTVGWSFDPTGPGLDRATAAVEGAWARGEAEATRTATVLEALLVYYDAAAAEAHVAIATQAAADLAEAARVLTDRESVGAGSGYHVTRMEVALRLAESELRAARGEAESAAAKLGALIGWQDDASALAGFAPLLSETALAELLDPRQEPPWAIRRAHEARDLAAKADDRAGLAWLPTVAVGAGVKRANNFAAADGFGYVLGIGLSVPVFDGGSARQAEARGQLALTTARLDALTRRYDADRRAALVTYRAARQEVQRFADESAAPLAALIQAARAGFRDGTLTVTELLDVQRASTEVAKRGVDLLATAKRAEARMRALFTGFAEPGEIE